MDFFSCRHLKGLESDIILLVMLFEVAQIVQMCTGCTPRITPGVPLESLGVKNKQKHHYLFCSMRPIQKFQMYKGHYPGCF
jgi:hypothetical protein